MQKQLVFLFSAVLASSAYSVSIMEKDFLLEYPSLLEERLRKIGNISADSSISRLLIEAVTKAKAGAVRVLLKYGADINFKGDEGETAMTKAACLMDMETFQVVVEHNEALARQNIISNEQRLATINHREHFWTSLMFAAFWGRAEKVEALLSVGARINDRDGVGQTALMIAIKERLRHVQKLPLGADIYINDNIYANDLERLFIRKLDEVIAVLQARS